MYNIQFYENPNGKSNMRDFLRLLYERQEDGFYKLAAFLDYLAENGVGTVIHYPIAPHKQECYANESWNMPQLSLPITESLADEELSLPMSPCLTQEQVELVVDTINEFK